MLRRPVRFVSGWPSWLTALVALLVAATVAGGGIAVRQHLAQAAASTSSRTVPQNAAMENLTGVRFSQVAVVADGGLITLSYVVLDSEKAIAFQSDTAHPPKLTSESRNLSTTKVALMKQGHALRAGQTFYLVYENTKGAVKPGERVTITDGQVVLAHVPVI